MDPDVIEGIAREIADLSELAFDAGRGDLGDVLSEAAATAYELAAVFRADLVPALADPAAVAAG